MKRLLSSLAVVGVLAALPHHSAKAQATDTTKKAAMATKKEMKEEKKEEKKEEMKEAMKEGKEAHPRLVAAIKRLEESKKDLEAAPSDFGGHKAEAIKSIDEAIKHVKLAQAADKK